MNLIKFRRSIIRKIDHWPELARRVYSSLFGLRCIDKNTDLVVEGFPRCGNTFTYAWVKSSNSDSFIAHHLHMSFQVVLAAKYEIPAIVLFRDPISSVASLIVRSPNGYDLESSLADYCHFYKRVLTNAKSVYLLETSKINSGCINDILKKINLDFRKDFRLSDSNKAKNFAKVRAQNEARHYPIVR